MESLNYKIDSARKELEAKKKGETKKVEKKITKESIRIEWKNIKDVMLLGYLIYTLISLTSRIDIVDIWDVEMVSAGSKVTIINRQENKEAEVSTNASPAEKKTAEFSAFSPAVEETDGTPYKTASGQYVRDGIVANNCLAFGTKIRVNDKEYEVADRMNSRYGCKHFDIFMWEKSDAIKFGRKELAYEVIK